MESFINGREVNAKTFLPGEMPLLMYLCYLGGSTGLPGSNHFL